MAIVMTPIYTQTAVAGSTVSVTFNNIPQFYTDLKVVISARNNGGTVDNQLAYARFNGDAGTNYSITRLYGTGASVVSDRSSNVSGLAAWHINGATSTANTYSSNEIYIPNYTSSNYKSTIIDYVTEGNVSSGYTFQVLNAGLWRSTSAINSITLYTPSGDSWTSYTTFSLYGIIRYGA